MPQPATPADQPAGPPVVRGGPVRPAQGLAAWPRLGLIGLVQGYRYLLKPWLGNGCRFEPTCSAYALEALRRHGAGWGTGLAAARILRCHPWCHGGCDPVPDDPRQRLFSRLLSSPNSPKNPP